MFYLISMQVLDILFPPLLTRRKGTRMETFGRREQRAANCMVELEYQMRFQWLNWHETLEDVLQLCNGMKTLLFSLHRCFRMFMNMCVIPTTRAFLSFH
jgi:hypothetical protein